MTDAEIDARCDAIMADVRAQCTTLRRSLGQRFRKIRSDQDDRITAILMRHVWAYTNPPWDVDQCATPAE